MLLGILICNFDVAVKWCRSVFVNSRGESFLKILQVYINFITYYWRVRFFPHSNALFLFSLLKMVKYFDVISTLSFIAQKRVCPFVK